MPPPLLPAAVPSGRLPDFLIIGAMKAGTTTLYNHLACHPRVFLPDYKEPEFFVAEKNWGRGLSWYQSLFSGASGEQLVGEGSTSYTKFSEFPGVPGRIHATAPAAKLIYILREPVERIRSMYAHMVLTGRERRPIDEAVLADDTYLGPSKYGENLRRYLDEFPREQLHVMLTEDLASDPTRAVRGVTRFLGVPDVEGFVRGDRADLRTSDRRADRWFKSRARGVAALEIGFRRLPGPAQRAVRRIATHEATGADATLLPETERELRQRLSADGAQLRRLLGPVAPTWAAGNRG
jgi:hypothetical protein